MFGTTWLGYFEGNTRDDRAPASSLRDEVPAELRSSLAISLGRFQLGESAGGRIHEEITTHPDAALDAPTRRSVQLYIEEEWRHSRELALMVRALGGETQTAHWTNGAFTACRRILGLRTKMMTLAIAEVIGIVYYRALATGMVARRWRSRCGASPTKNRSTSIFRRRSSTTRSRWRRHRCKHPTAGCCAA